MSLSAVFVRRQEGRRVERGGNNMRAALEFLSNDDLWCEESAVLCEGCCSEEYLISLLTGDDFSEQEFASIFRHLEYENLIVADSHKNALKFLNGIRGYGLHHHAFNHNKGSWGKAFCTFLRLEKRERISLPYKPNEDVILKSEAIKTLRRYGYQIPLKDGVFAPTLGDAARFGESISHHMMRIGEKALPCILSQVEHLFIESIRHYDFYPEPATINRPEVMPPWGYLLNVALSFFKYKSDAKNKKVSQEVGKIVRLAEMYFLAMELQPLSKFEYMLRPMQESLEELRYALLYQQHMAIDQLPIDDALHVISGLTSYLPPDVKLSAVLAILKWTAERCKGITGFVFYAKDLLSEIDKTNGLCDDVILKTLHELSTPIDELNIGYAIPEDVGKRNFYKRPFIKRADQYILLNSYFCSKGFYHVWLRLYGDNNRVGDLFESFLSDSFATHSVTFMRGKKYKIPVEVRKALSITSKGGECDFVIEGDKTIYFIELKKKELTGEAMAGNDLVLLQDLTKSTLAAFKQSLLHEYMLRKYGKIEFEDKSVLELKGRRVEKIHLSLFDRFVLHDQVLIKRFVECVCNYKFECKAMPEELNEFEKVQSSLRSIMMSQEITSAYVDGMISLSFRSFSMPQLLSVLKKTKSTLSFETQLNAIRCVSTGARDWYKEQAILAECPAS